MTEAYNLVAFSRGVLAPWGLSAEKLAAAVASWDNVAEARVVASFTPQGLGPIDEGRALFLVGRRDPVPGLEPLSTPQFPIDVAGLMPWLAGDPAENISALIRSALAAADFYHLPGTLAFEPYRRVLVFGPGDAAKATADALAMCGIEVVWAMGPGSSPADETLPHGVTGFHVQGLTSLTGLAGRFAAVLHTDNGPQKVRAGAIVFCGPEVRQPAVPLEKSADQKSITLTDFENLIETMPQAGGKVVFLAAADGSSSTSSMRRLFEASIRAVSAGAETYLAASQIKVAETGLERLYTRAREAGVVFLRTPASGPVFVRTPEGGLKLKVFDALVQAYVTITPDLIVVEDELRPSDFLKALSNNYGLTLGSDGYLAPDNVLFLSTGTNRRGIFALGPARGTDSPGVLAAEIAEVVEEIQNLFEAGEIINAAAVAGNECRLCLSCLRVCPALAVSVSHRALPDPAACVACGICLVHCPAQALDLPGYSSLQIEAQVSALLSRPRSADGPVRLVMFGCQRSAGQAMSSTCPAAPVDLCFVPLPCGGRVDENLIFRTFLAGADGVIVAVCHEDNCRSQAGSPEARRRTARTQSLMKSAGLDPQRLRFITLAPNQGLKLARDVASFSAELQ